jgi:N-acyl-D-aspartate/D-glutamate deacylase
MLDLLITNTNILTGIGEPSFVADIGIIEKKIKLIARDITQESAHTIRGDGLCVSPGFIDPHMHSDLRELYSSRGYHRDYRELRHVGSPLIRGEPGGN